MWVILTTKVPTKPSPPKLSIHWTIPWPNKQIAKHQCNHSYYGTPKKKPRGRPRKYINRKSLKYSHDFKRYISISPYQNICEPHWAGARKIHYKATSIRIFPHEFNILTSKILNMYLSESHTFIAGTTAEQRLDPNLIDSDMKTVYEAALIDGCNKQQAVQTVLGHDVTDQMQFPKPIGWYKIKPEYGAVFCYENELAE